MENWRFLLRRLVSVSGTKQFPLSVYKVDPPQNFIWPDELPVTEVLKEFYSICDGGYIDEYNWFSGTTLRTENARFLQDTKEYYPDGTGPLVSGRHIVLATDSGGAPLIWDKEEDRVATFWLDGGDWEPMNSSLEAFLENIFEPTAENDLWFEAVEQLRAI